MISGIASVGLHVTKYEALPKLSVVTCKPDG